MKWFIKCIRNYVNFKGRARRKEYWNFVLFSMIFMVIAMIIDLMIFGASQRSLIQPIFSLFLFLPQLAVMTRRLHDTNRSGTILLWSYVFMFIWAIVVGIMFAPIYTALMAGVLAPMSTGLIVLLIGGGVIMLFLGILFLVWFCEPGTQGENDYGPDPKAVEE